MLSREARVAETQRDSRQQQLGQHCLPSHRRRSEKLMRRCAKASRLKQASLCEKHQRLVQVNQRGPDLVLVADKHFSCPCEQLDRFKCLSLAAGRDRCEAQRLRRFIAKPEFMKTSIRRPPQLAGFATQIEFKINFR
jgi:hypothetical protein